MKIMHAGNNIILFSHGEVSQNMDHPENHRTIDVSHERISHHMSEEISEL
jgi:hypothetical protein